MDAATNRKRSRRPVVGHDAAAIVAYRGSPWVAMGTDRAALGLDGRTGEVRQRIPVSMVPRRLVVTRHGVWVANGSPGSLLLYDRTTGALLQSIPVPEGVSGLIAGGDAIWVVKRSNNKLTRFEPGADQAPGLDQPARPGADDALCAQRPLDRHRRREHDRARRCQGISSLTARRRRTGPGAGGPTRADASTSPSQDDNTVVVLDPESLELVEDPSRSASTPAAMVADDRSVWVVGLGDDSLTRIDYR